MNHWPLLSLPLLALSATAEITVNGISNRDIDNNRTTFEVPSEAGFTITALLDGSPVALDTPVEITRAGYYELEVSKTNADDLSEESTLIQFIVRDTARGSSELGLATWVPFPTIDSAPAAFADTRLEVVVPASLPSGFDIPVITRLREVNEDSGVRLNGTIHLPEVPGESIRLLRGFGSALVPAPTSVGPTVLTPTIADLSAPVSIRIEPSTTWTEVSSDLTESVDWGSEARIHITSDLTIAAGATLTIGPGTIVQLDPGVDIEVDGALQIEGSTANPIFFTKVLGSGDWGGFFLRQATSVANVTGAIFTGSGADRDWFNSSGYSHHRDEQATFLIDSREPCSFTDCFFIDLPGQALHGKDATIIVNDCLFQRLPTVGQFNGGNVTVTGSALLEFPDNTEIFTDEDNDGIYFTAGSHSLIETVIGWAKDDGVDAGSGSTGLVNVTDCWFEACFHEGMAWSGQGRTINVSGTVAMNCGQGIEAGWSGSANNNSPIVNVTRSLCLGNHIGWRFGDNYTWDYAGQLNVSDSLSLHNDRNVWGMEWDSWTYRLERMTIEDNHLSLADSRHPSNALWDGSADAALLVPFAPVANTPVGCGFAEWELQKPMELSGEGVTVALSEFSTLPVTIDYEVVRNLSTVLSRGTVTFAPGEIRKRLSLQPFDEAPGGFVRVSLTGTSGGTLTTPRNLFFLVNDTPVTTTTLIPAGAPWKFLDDGSDQGTEWREPGFDDSSWSEGAAQLGYGDGDEATEVSFGDDSSNKHATTYFRHTFTITDPDQTGRVLARLVRDDGAVVYVNGQEAFRSNIDPGPLTFDTFIENVASGESENEYFEELIPASLLVAGQNTIAVEVHQANATSSDLSFDLELLAEPPGETSLHLVTSAGESTLIWQADEGSSLQTSPDLSSGWTDLPGAASPMVIRPDSSEPRRFYRLAR